MKTLIVAAFAALCLVAVTAEPEPEPGYGGRRPSYGGYGGGRGIGISRGVVGIGGNFGGFGGRGISHGGNYGGYGRRWKRSADPEPAAEPEAEPGYGGISSYNYGGSSFGGFGGVGGSRGFVGGYGRPSVSYGRRWKRSADPEPEPEASFGYGSYGRGSFGGRGNFGGYGRRYGGYGW